MPRASHQFVEYVLEQLAPLRGLSGGRFFGGTGLAVDGVQFAMVIEGVMYFVVDDTTRPKYEHMGSACFAYDTKQRRVSVRKYYSVPADMIDDQDELVALARESIRVANAAKPAPAKRTNVSAKKRARSSKSR